MSVDRRYRMTFPECSGHVGLSIIYVLIRQIVRQCHESLIAFSPHTIVDTHRKGNIAIPALDENVKLVDGCSRLQKEHTRSTASRFAARGWAMRPSVSPQGSPSFYRLIPIRPEYRKIEPRIVGKSLPCRTRSLFISSSGHILLPYFEKHAAVESRFEHREVHAGCTCL